MLLGITLLPAPRLGTDYQLLRAFSDAWQGSVVCSQILWNVGFGWFDRSSHGAASFPSGWWSSGRRWWLRLVWSPYVWRPESTALKANFDPLCITYKQTAVARPALCRRLCCARRRVKVTGRIASADGFSQVASLRVAALSAWWKS